MGERGTRGWILFLFPTWSGTLCDSTSEIHFCHGIAIPGCRGMAGVWCRTEGYCDHGVTKISWDMGWPVSISTENSKCWPYSSMHPKFHCWFVREVLIWVRICSLLSKIGRSFGKLSYQSLTSVHWTHPNFNFSLPRVFNLHWSAHFHKRTGLSHKSIFFDSFKSLSWGMEMWDLLSKMSTDIFFAKWKE